MEIKFRDDRHKYDYISVLSRMKRRDSYHMAVAYLLTLDVVIRERIEEVFDFTEDLIELKSLHRGWQTGTSQKTTRLLMNLWNGTCSEFPYAEEVEISPSYAVDEIFCCGYAPYYWEAIKLRFPEYCGGE